MSLILSRTSPVACSTVSPACLGGVGVFWRVFVPLRTMRFGSVPKADVASVSNGVSRILFWTSIGQVGKMIIKRVAVKMTNPGSRLAFWTRADKGQGHEMVDHLVAKPSPDLKIFTSMSLRTHVNREVTASTPSSRADYSRPTLVDEIAREAWDFTKFIHPQIIAVA